MRKILLAATAALTIGLGCSAEALAQSHQGGYLGESPGTSQLAAGIAAPTRGSGQGGYLGLNPGANLKPASNAETDMRSSPEAWCRNSPEPSRCRARAAMEYQMCVGKAGSAYASCRFALDQMHGP
jgi:hypothetical protein